MSTDHQHKRTDIAVASGLRHNNDGEPGIRREGGTRFRYRWPNGQPVRDPGTLARINALAVPPAWRDVWICRDADGHLQATGRDKRGRKQYRYHADWTVARAESKYEQLAAFADCLATLRTDTTEALARRPWSRHRLAALGVRLLDVTAMRVGNEEYAEENGAYGLTTLLPEHDGSSRRRIRFVYPAKGGGEAETVAENRRAATLLRQCRATGGSTLLSFRDGGTNHALTSRQVNECLHDYDTTAKVFRTWLGSVTALEYRLGAPSKDKEQLLAAADAVAARLGNSRDVARVSYIHPAVLDASEPELRRLRRHRAGPPKLSRTERALRALLS